MPKHIDESLSALVDGEVDELELRRILNSCEKDPAVYESWRRMQMVRAVLNDEAISNVDLSVGIRQALDGVPMDDVPAEVSHNVTSQAMAVSNHMSAATTTDQAKLSPTPSIAPTDIMDTHGAETSGKTNNEATLGFSTLAKISSVAAMVGFVSATLALVVVDKLQSDGSTLLVAAPTVMPTSHEAAARLVEVRSFNSESLNSESGLVAYPLTDSRLDDQLDAYLMQHAEFSSINTGRGLMPFARVDGWHTGNGK